MDTAQNPADHTSRGLHALDITSSSWLSGPEFLWEQEVHLMPKLSTELLTGDSEVKSIQVLATQVCDRKDILNRLSRFSTWTMLVKVVSRIKRLGYKLKHLGKIVTVKECRKAAKGVFQLVQQQAFPQELKALQGNFHENFVFLAKFSYHNMNGGSVNDHKRSL